jgi:hypothetical protein
MIAPQSQGRGDGSPSGTRGNPITVRALNDGAVLIDGQFVRTPVWFRGNTDIEVLGINAANAGSNRNVYHIENAAKRISFRRVIGWDQALSGTGRNIFGTEDAGTQDILFEDCAGFGVAQRMARGGFGGSVRATFRRCWFRHEGDPDLITDPTNIFNIVRGSGGPIVENTIFIWDGSRLGANAQRGISAAGKQVSGTTARFLGSIIYGNPNSLSGAPINIWAQRLTSAIFDHVVIDARNSSGPPATFECLEGCTGPNIASNITTIRSSGAPGPKFTGEWTGGNRNHGTWLGAVPNIFTGPNAANICKRYQDGVLTNIPLWPWPMDQRIKDAIDQARAGQANPKSPHLIGDSVTAEVESRFGTVPSECRSG